MRLFIIVFLVTFTLNAQEEDAWVYFTDKENVAESLADPITILTQKALDRKERHEVVIDERDVPVNETYIATVKEVSAIQVLAKSKWFNCIYVRGELAAIQSLGDLSFVQTIVYADPNLTRQADTFGFKKADPLTTSKSISFNYGATENQTTQLNAQALHEADFTGEGITIAVLDSGFPGVDVIGAFQDLRNEDRLLDGYDFVNREENEFAFQGSSHGTRVLSDIAGFIEDQFVGTAPDARIYCFITEESGRESPAEEAYWVEAAERADSLGVDVINTSLGYRTFDNPAYDYTYEDMNGETAFISRGATQAFEKGMLVVTSAGNSGTGRISAPADAVGAFTVGAVQANGTLASFSSRGPSSDGRVKPDVMAQGANAAVVDQNGNITTNNGTSFSSPIMAGAVACFWQAFPSMTNAEIMQAVRETGSTFENPNFEFGYGIPDFGQALENLSSNETVLGEQIALYPNPANDKIHLSGIWQATQVVIRDVRGVQLLEQTISPQSPSLDIERLPQGIYVTTFTQNNKRSSLKLIKN